MQVDFGFSSYSLHPSVRLTLASGVSHFIMMAVIAPKG